MTIKVWALLFQINTICMSVFTIALFVYHIYYFFTLSDVWLMGELFLLVFDIPAMLLLAICSVFLCLGCVIHYHTWLLVGTIFQCLYGLFYGGIALLIGEKQVFYSLIGGKICLFVSILFLILYFLQPKDKRIW